MRVHRLLLFGVLGWALAAFGQPAAAGGQAVQKAPPAKAAPSNTPARQKLVMKDGNDQLVRGWEMKGDRVRYYSLERDEWEEIPAAQVDWKATEEANRSAQAEALEEAKQADEMEREAKTELLGAELAPGVRLPNGSDGLFVILSGKLTPLTKQQAAARVDKGRMATNVILPLPVLKTRNLVEIPGARASVRLPASPEALFAAGRARDDSRYALARLKPKGNVRQVEAIEVNLLGRNPKHAGDYIELDSETIAPDVFKLVPRQPLTPGEYAVVEFIGKDLNMYMWDFAVEK
jgi:hypothetical protein